MLVCQLEDGFDLGLEAAVAEQHGHDQRVREANLGAVHSAIAESAQHRQQTRSVRAAALAVNVQQSRKQRRHGPCLSQNTNNISHLHLATKDQ